MYEIPIKEVTIHKHLGVTLQQNGKWSIHLAEMNSNAKRKVDILRSRTYKLNRKTLHKIYLAYIRPNLEYASCVWDNCTATETQNTEDVQLAALRAITGTKRGTSHQNLYMETGIEELKSRRTKQKLILMYKIQNDLVPNSLIALLPETTFFCTQLQLRNARNITIPKAKTSAFQQSFFPLTIKAWNALDTQTRQTRSIHQFKESFTNPIQSPPTYFMKSKDRKAEISHTRISV